MIERARYASVVALVVGLTGCAGDPPADAGPAPVRPGPVEVTAPAEAPPSGVRPQPPTTVPVASSDGPGEARARLPFPADIRPDLSSMSQGWPVLVEVAKGTHPGYARYVFRFADNGPQGQQRSAARPAWDVRYVPYSEAVLDGSGSPAPVGGAVVLRVGFDAAMHWDDGTPSLVRSVEDHDPLVFGSDFEGQVTWFLGLDQEQPFRAFFVEDGSQGEVVVDVVEGR
jgi:hypothetical protein